MFTFNYGSPHFVVLSKFISLCCMVWDLICGTSWFYKSKTGKVTGGGKSTILPNCCYLLSITVLSTPRANRNKKAPSELISPRSTIKFHAKGRCSGCRLMHLFSLFFSQQWVLEAINRGGKYCASNTLFLSLILLLW